MGEGNSVINLGDLSKPATVLIEKVSDAVGVLYEPRRIRKRAEAEAEADKIKALSSIELNEIQQRAVDRLVHQEARKQENIEAITAQAAKSLGDDANPEDLEEDWVAHFFKNCDTVSDKEMQSFWSKLLSGEATRPGTFSKRTVDLVASMDKKDAKLFTEFCQFCWFTGEVIPLILDIRNDVFNKKGINFSSLKHLDSIGLISYEVISGYLSGVLDKSTQISYFGSHIIIEFKKDSENKLNLGNAMLTKAGQELASICGAQRNNEFFEYILESWYEQGFVLSTPITIKKN
jgi:hypothetical protein